MGGACRGEYSGQNSPFLAWFLVVVRGSVANLRGRNFTVRTRRPYLPNGFVKMRRGNH